MLEKTSLPQKLGPVHLRYKFYVSELPKIINSGEKNGPDLKFRSYFTLGNRKVWKPQLLTR